MDAPPPPPSWQGLRCVSLTLLPHFTHGFLPQLACPDNIALASQGALEELCQHTHGSRVLLQLLRPLCPRHTPPQELALLTLDPRTRKVPASQVPPFQSFSWVTGLSVE